MKAINLKTLVDSYKSLDKELLSSYLGFFGIELAEKGKNSGLKEVELECLSSFIDLFLMEKNSTRILDNFFVGYKIPQIGKEFDLLRINDKNVVNIELKSKASKDKILKQLKRNLYYLHFLDKEMFLFTYVMEDGQLYMLDKKELVPIEISVLIKTLIKENKAINNIDKLFNPSNYLISPFNSTKKFMEEVYFLTAHQEEIKNNILNAIEGTESEFIAITGAAGTGKTLLTYDIAKDLMNKRRKKVLIVHCAKLNNGQSILNEEYDWNICMARIIQDGGEDLKEFDVIIVDEAQRIRPNQLDILKEIVSQNKMKCIFSFDKKQYLRNKEKSQNMTGKILNTLTQPVYKLTDKIRSNKEIASFIQALFNNKEIITHYDYSNIQLHYCSTEGDVIELSKYLQEKNWTVPNYTPGTRSAFNYQKYGIDNGLSAHAVIGQEFDKVVAIIDNTFNYDVDGKLIADNHYYSQRQMLYQILTRTRQELYIVIFKNEIILKRCLEILKK